MYVETALGLQHLVADGPDFDKFRLGRLYTMPNVTGTMSNGLHSKLGYIAIPVFRDPVRREFCLYLVRLPTAQ